MGRCGGQVVSKPVLYSNGPSSNPTTWSLQFFCKIVVEKNKTKQKVAEVGPYKKHNTQGAPLVCQCYRCPLIIWYVPKSFTSRQNCAIVFKRVYL